MTITEFLEARIAEDEAAARRVESAHWTVDDDSYVVLGSDGAICYDVLNEGVSQHIARHDPARVLAECAAKRAIMKEHELDLHSSAPYCDGCAEWWASELGEGPPPVKYPCPTIRAIAAVYADHTDYQQEWAL